MTTQRPIEFRAWEYLRERTSGKGWQDTPLAWRMNYSPILEGDETSYEYDYVHLNKALQNGGDATGEREKLSIFMQYTGLLDKNKNKVFEGDIVKVKIYKEPYEIYYANGGFRLKKQIFNETLTYLVDNKVDIEVIGNVHENKNLLTNT